jgi:tetratricopeptide (TPR) repeat protein
MSNYLVKAGIIFSGTVLCIVGFKAAALTQEMPACYIMNSSGEVINLMQMCLKQQQVLSSQRQFQSLYRQIDTALNAGRLEEASEGLTQLISLQPNSADLYSFRGHMRLFTGDLQGGIADLQKASELFRAKKDLEMANYLQQTVNDIKNGRVQINRQQ